jgi:hypothetical protein
LPFLPCALITELSKRHASLLPLPAYLGADVFKTHSTRRFGMIAQFVDWPCHHQVSATNVIDDGHVLRGIEVSLNDRGLLDISAWGPHADIVPP